MAALDREEEVLIDPQFGIYHTQIAVVLDTARKSMLMERGVRDGEAVVRKAKEVRN